VAFNIDNVNWDAVTATGAPAVDDETVGELNLAQVEQSQQLRPTLNEAMKVNPEQFVKTKLLSEQSGMPPAAVEADPEAVERTQQLDSIDFYNMSQKNPVTYEHLSQYENAAIAHDDIPTLQKIESAFDNLNKDFKNRLDEDIDSGNDYLTDIGTSYHRGAANVEIADIHTKQMMAGLFGSEPASPEDLARLTELTETQSKELLSTDLNYLTEIPLTAAEQLPILFEIGGGALQGAAVGSVVTGGVPTAAALFTTGPAGALATYVATGVPGAKMGAQFGVALKAFTLEGGLARSEFIGMTDDQGNVLDEQLANQGALAVGIVNAGLESASLLFGFGRTVSPAVRFAIRSRVKNALLTESGRAVFGRIAAGYAAAVAAEGFTEGAQEFVTIFTGEIAKIMDESSFDDASPGDLVDLLFDEQMWDRVAESFEKGTQAAVAFGAPGTLIQVYQNKQAKAQLAQNEQAQINAINESTADAKLKEHSVDTFRDFVQKADKDKNTHLFIDADLTTLYLQGKTDEEINADPALTLLSEKLGESEALKTDIVIPIADVAADMTGTEHFDALREGMSLSEEVNSPFQQENAERAFADHMAYAANVANENVSQYVEAQQIVDTVKGQLIDSGEVLPQHAKVMSDFVAARMVVFAKEQNIGVQEAFDRFGFTVEGPQTGEMARLSEETLSQTPALSAKQDFGDATISEEVEVEGTQGTVTITQPAQKVFDATMQRRNVVEQLVRCL